MRTYLFAITLAAALAAGGGAYGDTLTVVTATTDLRSIAQSVGGDRVTAASIARGTEDPHFIQAKPSYMMVAKKADLWVKIGMELEIGWEGPILEGARNAKTRPGLPGYLDASENIIRLEVPTGQVTREMGDVHPEGNPHYWLDPWNGRIIAKEIAERLAVLDPGGAETYAKNLQAFEASLDEHMFGGALVKEAGAERLWEEELKGTLPQFLQEQHLTEKIGGWAGAMLPYRGEKIITFHRSWTYFANRFGLTVADQLEPKPGIPPSPGHVLEVIETVKAQKIHALLMEPYYDRKAGDTVAEKAGLVVVVCANSVGGEATATDYFATIGNVVEKLTAVFKSAHASEGR